MKTTVFLIAALLAFSQVYAYPYNEGFVGGSTKGAPIVQQSIVKQQPAPVIVATVKQPVQVFPIPTPVLKFAPRFVKQPIVLVQQQPRVVVVQQQQKPVFAPQPVFAAAPPPKK